MSSFVSPQSLQYAGMSAGIWVITQYGLSLALGTDLSLMDVLTDSAIMGASAVGSDYVQTAFLGMRNPTPLSSAVGAGAMYTAIQAVRGDSGYLDNFLLASANDYVTQMVSPAN